MCASSIRQPRGGRRLARHLWRMCFALFIAAGSFFSIRERVATILPEPLTTGPMRALPILLLFGAMFYWLWRVRRRDVASARSRGFDATRHAREVIAAECFSTFHWSCSRGTDEPGSKITHGVGAGDMSSTR